MSSWDCSNKNLAYIGSRLASKKSSVRSTYEECRWLRVRAEPEREWEGLSVWVFAALAPSIYQKRYTITKLLSTSCGKLRLLNSINRPTFKMLSSVGVSR